MVEEYCTSYCSFQFNEEERYEPALCGTPQIPVLCTEDECCQKKCLEENNSKCDSAFQLVDEIVFCQKVCADPTYDDGTFHECTFHKECTPQLCQAMLCMDFLTTSSPGIIPVCSSDGLWFKDSHDYCMTMPVDHTQYMLCAQSACTTDFQCCKTHCMANNAGLTFPSCLKEGFIIRDLEAYCDTYCPSRHLDILLPSLSTQGGNASELECCQHNCNHHHFKSVCDGQLNLVTDHAAFCGDKCGGQLFYTCGSDDCDDKDCKVKQCLQELEKADYQGYTICSNTLRFFYSLKEFCEAKYESTHEEGGLDEVPDILGHKYCNGVPCLNQKQCCADECQVQFLPFTPKCDQEFHPFLDINKWCGAFCPYGEAKPLLCGANECSLNECCVKKCKADPHVLNKCALDYLSVVPSANYCEQKQCQEDFELITCYSADRSTAIDCNPKQCAIERCLSSLVSGSYPYDSVCGMGTERYDNHYQYCDAFYKILVTDYIFCKEDVTGTDIECDGGDANHDDKNDHCCYQNCLNDHAVNFNGRCKQQTNKWYETSQEFCQELCYNDFTVRLCAGGVPCNKSECCYAGCPDFPFYDMCSPDLSTVWDLTTYCATNCLVGSEFGVQALIHLCDDRKCLQRDCDMMACLKQFENVPFTGDDIDKKVCGDNSILYPNAEAYCSQQIKGVTQTFKLCNGTYCLSAQQCRKVNCMVDIQVYAPRCDSASFYWFATKEEWCQKYSEVILINPYTCATSTYCDQEDCCFQRCVMNPNRNTCSLPDYSLYVESQNCLNQCQGVTQQNIECPSGNCSQNECYLMMCMKHIADDLYSDEEGICDNNGQWYKNHHDYCLQYVASANTLGFDACRDEQGNPVPCLSEKQCCNQSCHDAYATTPFDHSTNTGLCEDGSYNQFTTLASFCEHVCENKLDVFNEAMCGVTKCTVEECCYL